MKIDGRLEKLSEMARENGRRRSAAPKHCSTCGRAYKPLRKGRCAACDKYLRDHGIEWTPDVVSRKPRR